MNTKFKESQTPAAHGASHAEVEASRREGRRKRKRAETLTGYTMLIPSFIGVGIFLIVPVFAVVVLSFTKWNLVSPIEWVGFANYERLMGDSGFWNSLLVTLIFSLIAIPGTIIIGLLIATGLNQRLPGTGLLQLLYILPWVAAPLALGVVWQWLLEPNGVINDILGTDIAWMSDRRTALPTVALVYVWQNVGYVSLFFLAALQNIPKSIFEAAELDGAGWFRKTWSITLPLIRPTMFFVLVTTFISSLQVYDLVFGLTGGNPGYPGGTTDVITARIYNSAFASPAIGNASAMAVILTIVIVIITLIQQRYFSGRMTYEME